ncbi:hypothetical protein LDENG_00225460 [Lucifuga dentata]|nr:hypothetical protein LDENG_00225460 [Lucifuga dentata]
MESPQFSSLSSLRGEFKSKDYIQPHYKETYRLAIDCLVSGGRDSYQDFLKRERIGSFLSEEELLFITTKVEEPPPGNHTEEINGALDSQSSSGTYWPTHSDVETPDLDLGWPDIMHEEIHTSIDVLFHPPRQNSPKIKEVIRKHIQDARKVIAIVMDTFTDVDIFKEAVDASVRGVPVYILLDDFHWKSFLAMVENQDIKLQQLRNMRVRTVKGQDYLCRSGAKFHGAMEQKFLLVDCQTVLFGSYSFTWLFEKINLSMMQVIKGHLVESYDEEFRTLYARSTVPAELSPPDGVFQQNGSDGRQFLPKCVSHSTHNTEKGNQLMHTLDTVYQKTCKRQQGMRELEERLYAGEPLEHIENDLAFQSPEKTNFLKRHSYAGERQDGQIAQITRHRASNWNISRDVGNGRNNYCMDNYSPMPPIYRGQHRRQSYHGVDKQALPMQQNMPVLESTSKSFMRSWRIESYLKNADVSFRDSCDYIDQFESPDKSSSFMHARRRSSLPFRSTIPEQIEENIHINDSYTDVCQTNPPAVPGTALQYSSVQWNPLASIENRINAEEMKRRSLQILDDARNNLCYGPGRNSYQSAYASLGRVKGGLRINNPDILMDSWQKRHSVADPKSNTEYSHESSAHMYGGVLPMMQMGRDTTRINAQNGGYGLNLNEDQRSVSHFDIKSITDTKNLPTPIWQEPPSRTVSAAALALNSKDLMVNSNSMGSHHFFKKSSKKMQSLLNIPEKKEVSMETLSFTSGVSSDTLTTEDADKKSARKEKHRSPTSSVRPSPEQSLTHEDLKLSKPRFKTEERHPQQDYPLHITQNKHPAGDKKVRPNVDLGNWNRDRGAENHLYSRFEPFCAFEKKPSVWSTTRLANMHTPEKTKNPATAEVNLSRPARNHHENKLEKFIQRMGNLIHKNKQ